MITTIEEENELEKLEQNLVKEEKEIKKVEEKSIPVGYVAIPLDSLGKLSAPNELHFRDYSMEEVMELASTTDDMDNLGAVVRVLNNMVFEDFDCGDFTHEELMEVLLNLQGIFYDSNIERRVIIDENGDVKDIANYTYASIPLSAIQTNCIAEEFKEPFILTDSKIGKKYSFRLPRVKDKLNAEEFLKKKYSREIRGFSEIYYEIQKIESIKDLETRQAKMKELEDERLEEVNALRKYLMDKAKLLLILTQGLSLVAIDGKELDYGNCEELLELIPLVSRRVWQEYGKITEKYTFGLDPEVTFFLPEAQKEVTRRLAFQPLAFLPNYKQEIDSGVTVSFS